MILVGCIVTLATLAFADDGSCWKPARPSCPDGVSDENGKRCGAKSLIVVESDPVRAQDKFCSGHSRKCNNNGKSCNQRWLKDATWRRVNCVNQENGTSTFLGWCLDQEFSNKALDEDCSGKPCRKAGVQVQPVEPSIGAE